MHAKSLLIIMCFSAIILIGSLLFSPVGQAFTLTAKVDIDPDAINLNRNARWITAHIELPEGYNVSDIDPTTILLENLYRIEGSDIQGNVLIVKFDAFTVTSYLWERLYHMSVNRASIELTIEGQLKDTTTHFEGSDTITIMNPFEH